VIELYVLLTLDFVVPEVIVVVSPWHGNSYLVSMRIMKDAVSAAASLHP
jgi:hypothetical protein